MRAKYDRSICKACGGTINLGDEIGYRENFLLCESCCQIFDHGMTELQARAERDKRRRSAARAYAVRAAKRARRG